MNSVLPLPSLLTTCRSINLYWFMKIGLRSLSSQISRITISKTRFSFRPTLSNLQVHSILRSSSPPLNPSNHLSTLTTNSILSRTMSSSSSSSNSFPKQKVAIIGSGNWGSAIAKIAGNNANRHKDLFQQEIKMYVYEEIVSRTGDSRIEIMRL